MMMIMIIIVIDLRELSFRIRLMLHNYEKSNEQKRNAFVLRIIVTSLSLAFLLFKFLILFSRENTLITSISSNDKRGD